MTTSLHGVLFFSLCQIQYDKNKKSHKNYSLQTLMFQYAASDSEILDDSSANSQGKLSPRTSISAAEDDPPSGTNTPRRRFSKFNLGV
jgi:hypothetical protein